jgi:multiple sugar transport system ATP-binding protein
MTALALHGLSKSFEDIQALDDVTCEVADSEFFCVVGPTNAGKSTLLKTIAGLYKPDAGRIDICGRDVTAEQPKDRRVSLLFQNIALFPTLTGYENIAFPLRTTKVPETEVATRVQEVAALLKVEHLLERLPKTFSGGEQQRVAIGRAIVQSSDLLMLDEPLTNLDARIRIALRIEFKKLQKESGQSVIYVTHDQVEAMSLSDRIAVLHQGRFQQIGTPDDIYHRPANRFVARFIGTPPMNLMEAELVSRADDPVLVASGFRVAVPEIRGLACYEGLPRRLALGVRPEEVRVGSSESETTPLAGEVFWIEHLGAKSVLDARLGDATIKAVVGPDHAVSREGPAWFGFDPKPHYLLDLQSEEFFR